MSSPILHFKMNDTSGTTVVDSSGNGYNGTSARDTSLMTVAGKINTALQFDGTDDIIYVPHAMTPAFSSDFTINFWMKPANISPTTEEGIFGVQQAGSGILNIYQLTGLNGIDASYVPDGAEGITNLTVPLFNSGDSPSWKMITLVVSQVDPNHVQGKMYVNGVLGAISNLDYEKMLTWSTTHQPQLGDMDPIGGGSVRYNGVIDDFRVYNEALSAEEINSLWNNGNGTELEDPSLSPLAGSPIIVPQKSGQALIQPVKSGTVVLNG
jgi:hypothetical protein